MDIGALSYEESEEKLKDILIEMEEEELSLEESINKFKLANKLYEHCNKLLDEAEGEIKIILEGEEKDFSLEA